MSLFRASSLNSNVSKFSSFGEPLVVRMFGEEILEIFLDKTAFLFGILSNPKEGVLRKRVTFLPLQPVLPEQVETLQKLLSPEMSSLRLKHLNVIQIEPKLLGGGVKIEIDPKIKIAGELFLKLIELTKEDLVGIKQGGLFDKIRSLSKALPSLSNYQDQLADAWYVAKVLHMAVDVLLFTIWVKEKGDSQNTRYSFEQKKAILKPIRTAKKILERQAFLMREATLLLLDLTETGVQLLPELDMKPKDWKTFIEIGETVNNSFTGTKSSESDNSRYVSKLLTDLWFSLGGHWAVSPNLYGDSILATVLPLNETFQISELTNLLKCSSVEETFSLKEFEENPDAISRHLLAFDRLTNLSLYESREDLREQAFHEICRWTNSKNETLRNSAILSLKQLSLLSQDPLIKREALEVLDAINLSQEEGLFLFSYQKWVIDNLPRGYLDEENLKIERALQKATDQGSFNTIKQLSFCAADESIPPLFLENEFDSFGSGLQRLVNLGLVQKNSGAYKISKKTQDRLKKFITERDESDGKTLLGLARSVNRVWNFDEMHLDAPIDQQGNIPLHIQSFVENILKENQTSDSLVIASIVFLNKLGLYHLFIRKDLKKALESFKKALHRFYFLSRETEREALPEFVLPKKQDIQSLSDICCSINQTETEVDLLGQKLDLYSLSMLSALIKTFSSISSLKINSLNSASIEALALGIRGSKLLNLDLQSSEIALEGARAFATALPTSHLTNLNLYSNKIDDEGAKALAAALPTSHLTNLNLQSNNIGSEGAKTLAAALPTSKLTNLDLQGNRISNGGAIALATALPDSKLTKLNLNWNDIGAEGAKALATALPDSKLTKLNLNSNYIGAEGAKALAIALPASQLIKLDLFSNNIGAEATKALAIALPSSQLINLDLRSNHIGDEGAKGLATALRTSQLINLILQSNHISDEGANALAASLPTSQLTKLGLSWNQISDKGAKDLAAALPASKLTKLNLNYNKIGAEGAKALAIALPSSKLTNLNLSLNGIGSEGAKDLAIALPSSKLTNLNLYSNKIDDEGAKALAIALPSSQVTNLNLYSNEISDKGAIALAASLTTSQLTDLDLQANGVGVEGAKALATALPTSQLTSLNLKDNKIGSEGAKALAIALPSSQLTSLNLQSNKIGAEGANALKSSGIRQIKVQI